MPHKCLVCYQCWWWLVRVHLNQGKCVPATRSKKGIREFSWIGCPMMKTLPPSLVQVMAWAYHSLFSLWLQINNTSNWSLNFTSFVVASTKALPVFSKMSLSSTYPIIVASKPKALAKPWASCAVALLPKIPTRVLFLQKCLRAL